MLDRSKSKLVKELEREGKTRADEKGEEKIIGLNMVCTR